MIYSLPPKAADTVGTVTASDKTKATTESAVGTWEVANTGVVTVKIDCRPDAVTGTDIDKGDGFSCKVLDKTITLTAKADDVTTAALADGTVIEVKIGDDVLSEPAKQTAT